MWHKPALNTILQRHIATEKTLMGHFKTSSNKKEIGWCEPPMELFLKVVLKNSGLPKTTMFVFVCNLYITQFYPKIMKPLSYERNNMILLVHETIAIPPLLLEVPVPSQ